MCGGSRLGTSLMQAVFDECIVTGIFYHMKSTCVFSSFSQF